jgi:signal transduction histidine kinase
MLGRTQLFYCFQESWRHAKILVGFPTAYSLQPQSGQSPRCEEPLQIVILAGHTPVGRKTLVVFGVFVTLVLVIINLTGWALWHFTGELFQELLDRQLTAIASLVSRHLDGDALMRMPPGDSQSPAFQRFQRELAEQRATLRLADLYIFDAEDRILVSAVAGAPAGQVNPGLVLDTGEIMDAWMGKTSISGMIARGGNILKTGYAPILDPQGRVVAILAAETDVRFFDKLGLLRNGLVLVAAVLASFVIVLALLFRRAMRALLQAQEHYQETARLALLGRMSAQICHEIRNPLSIISASTEFVGRRLEKLSVKDPQICELVGSVLEETDRLNGIVTRFLETARTPVLDRKPTTVETLLAPLLKMVGPELEKVGIRLNCRLPAGNRVVNVDEGSIRQVLLNAVLNARDAMADTPRKELGLVAEEVGSGQVRISIEDTGCGVPADVAQWLFEPFVTSKASGTGLGLFVAKTIADEHGGSVRLESLAGGGTRFALELPVVEPA